MNECFRNIYNLAKSTFKSVTIKTPFVNFTFAPLKISVGEQL